MTLGHTDHREETGALVVNPLIHEHFSQRIEPLLDRTEPCTCHQIANKPGKRLGCAPSFATDAEGVIAEPKQNTAY